MANKLKFQEENIPVDEHLRPIKVDDELTAIETASHGNGARVNGDLTITGKVPEVRTNKVTGEGEMDITTSSGDIKIETDNGDIILNPKISQDVHIKSSETTMTLNNGASGVTSIKQMSLVDTADYSMWKTTTNGATTLETVDDDAALAHLTLDPDGDLIISGADIKITATKKLYLDGGTDTYLHEVSADQLDIVVGGNTILEIVEGGGGADDTIAIQAENKLYLDGGGDTYIAETAADNIRFYAGGDAIFQLSEKGTAGNVCSFGGSSAGFAQFEPTYNATDTNVGFHQNGNKAHLTFTSASETITDIHLFFPDISCNCVLLIKQHASGGGAVTNWKTWDQSSGNESTVVWAGGSAPTLTTGGGKIDILSFYWDNDNHKAYGVASLNF